MGTVAATILAMSLTVTPSNGGLLSPAQITINKQAGDQFDPHVDQNIAAYSNEVTVPGTSNIVQEIRYYEFLTNSDFSISNVLPDGSMAQDLLSDVDQGRIVFTRIFPGRSAIMLFDTTSRVTTELAPAPASDRMGVAIGGQTVAFLDFKVSGDGTGEVMVLNLATSMVTRLTTDTVFDRNVAVSPDGNVVTWERCVSSANCDIYRAFRSNSAWTLRQMSFSPLNELRPDTNGTQIVFQREDSIGPTGTNIVMVPVAGGTETVFDIAADQFNPSIRGQILAFETRLSVNRDLYVVDLASNRMFQITNTPDIVESLNDVTVLPGGEVRLVWQSVQTAGDTSANIYAATFALPAAPPVPVPVCRSVAVEATRYFSPTRSVDGDASFSPALSFAIPASLPVTAGNAGNHKASLTIDLGSRSIECEYRSGSSQSHPRTPAQLALASSYVLSRCEVVQDDDGDDDDGDDDDGHHAGPSYVAGTVVRAVSVHLHIQNGDTRQPMTRVRVVLAEVCGTSTTSSPLEASNPIDAPQAAGCSSSGASQMPFLLAFAFLALMMRRPASIRLVVRREQRRLSR